MKPRNAPTRSTDLGPVEAGAVYPLPVLRKRLGWGNRTAAQAQRDGLKATRYGHVKYVLGADVLAFFARLRDQGAPGNQDGGDGGPAP
jgi:hypothetical protein